MPSHLHRCAMLTRRVYRTWLVPSDPPSLPSDPPSPRTLPPLRRTPQAKTHEKVDSIGEERSIACHAVAMLIRKDLAAV